MTALVPPPRAPFTTKDPDEAHAFFNATYATSRMRITGPSRGFRMLHTQHEVGPFAVSSIRHTMGVEHDIEPFGQLVLCRVLRGRVERETGSAVTRAGTGDLLLMARPDEPKSLRWSSVDIQLTRVDPQLLADVAGLPADQLRFTGLEPVPGPAVRHLTDTLDFVIGSLLTGRSGDPDLVVDSAARVLAAAVLAAFPNTSDGGPPSGAPVDTVPSVLRRAVAFIETNAERPIGVTDIATAVRVTPRSVQLAFRNHLDTTPMTYLRDVRLDLAHHELAAADPDGPTTVTAVATRWGFTNAGRFSARYRRTYGASPVETLNA